MRKSFLEYLMLKETSEQNLQQQDRGLASEIKLSDDGEFKPFVVGDENHPNLKVIVQAFLDSAKVAFPGPDGYPQKLTTLDTKGESTPKLKQKKLYLVGGAVRDHLLGKTPKDYDLATDATPDEIRLILRSAGFTEVKPQTGKNAPKDVRYEKHPEPGNKNKIFYAKGWDRAGREFVIGARVNGEEFEIATFRKDSKGSDGRTPDRMEFTPSLEDDAARRDFTINAMAIPLTSADGPNAKLIDPHGGAHHLRRGEVRFVGNPKDRLQEDQLRALRYIRFVARFGGGGGEVPPEVKEAISEIRDLPSVSRERIRDEFVKGLEHPDVDPKKYIRMYKELGLLQTVFPGMTFKLDDLKKDYSDKKDKRLQVAWILRNNNPDDIKEMLAHGTWTNSEINDIIHLIKMNGWAAKYGKDDSFWDDFYDMKSNLHQRTSLVPSIVRQWGQMNNHDEEMLDNFLSHELSTKGYVRDNFGQRVVNPALVQLYGKAPEGKEFGDGIRRLETDRFRSRFAKNKKKDGGEQSAE